HVVHGGRERSDSVRIALDAAVARVADARVVLVHDAARAFTPASVIRSVIAAVEAGANAVVPVLPVADTVKEVDAAGQVVGTLERSTLRVAQTPQGFHVDLLRRAHSLPGAASTDDAGLVERLGEPVSTVPGHPHAMKITTPIDLVIAEALFTEVRQ
ncbi:MAG: 2-C-methyl-D-erythritol 4-phosphate cytidylyltransferase, partial [Kutzneria sp.]|nr:2-C-methyl-D-erythritol 4-phosphate cytidylyltransferase [Kutzneria sp.]